MFSSLVVDLAQEVGADFIVKGLRAVSDFESELQMAQMNHAISGVDTLFIPSASTHSFLASKLIREIARRGNVDTMVPRRCPSASRGSTSDERSGGPNGPSTQSTGVGEMSDRGDFVTSLPASPHQAPGGRALLRRVVDLLGRRPGPCRCRPR